MTIMSNKYTLKVGHIVTCNLIFVLQGCLGTIVASALFRGLDSTKVRIPAQLRNLTDKKKTSEITSEAIWRPRRSFLFQKYELTKSEEPGAIMKCKVI